jgi:hypothetical protein
MHGFILGYSDSIIYVPNLCFNDNGLHRVFWRFNNNLLRKGAKVWKKDHSMSFFL